MVLSFISLMAEAARLPPSPSSMRLPLATPSIPRSYRTATTLSAAIAGTEECVTREWRDGRVRSGGAAEAPVAQDPVRRPAIPRRAALPPRDDGLVPAARPRGAHRALPRGRDLRRGRAARARLPATHPRSGGRAGQRSRRRGIQGTRPLG